MAQFCGIAGLIWTLQAPEVYWTLPEPVSVVVTTCVLSETMYL